MTQDTPDVFASVVTFPDPGARKRYNRLVGLDAHKSRLEKGLALLIDPESAQSWSERHFHNRVKLVEYFLRRPPLFLLVGDVGTGKTELAETVGDAVARQNEIGVTLYKLSLASRGTGLVGEMSSLIARAFAEVSEVAKAAKSKQGKARAGFLFLIDEADALAQSRDTREMHHEDRTGVNTLIQGVDNLSTLGVPAAVIMCTNRLSAIDPAVRRRAADLLEFERPSTDQRLLLLQETLMEIGFSKEEVCKVVQVTAGTKNSPAYTFSDLTQRFLPNLLLAAYPNDKPTFELAMDVLGSMTATPAFKDEG